jgi:hypothetical protein
VEGQAAKGRNKRRGTAVFLCEACEPHHKCAGSNALSCDGTDLEGTMRKIALLLAVTALCLGIVEVWTGGSRTDTSENAAVFVISNAL